MLEKILKMYTTAMATGVTSPLPHMYGPPGTGKSSVVRQAADLLGVNLHTINLSRVSPLELEGVQMPQGIAEEMKLKLLHATYWTQLKEGDILLFDEFLRAFPEVMSGLLDIITAREVSGFTLPKVFILAASNSVIAYDKALEDRLLHLPVEDARKSKAERDFMSRLIVDEVGLLPIMAQSAEMEALIREEVLPMYEVLDHLKKRSAPPVIKGRSVRNLIGQAQLREVQSMPLRELIDMNNTIALNQKKYQYVVLLDGTGVREAGLTRFRELLTNPVLTEKQRVNVRLNVEFVEMEAAREAMFNHPDQDREVT